jgi:hypothetical protein
MCNAHNHSYDCPCGFGGDTGGGGGRRSDSGRYRAPFTAEYALYGSPSGGWARDRDGTVSSYVNPNAHCPVCGATVFFYRSPYDGRVFFDRLGWPWPKHPCTDNSGYIRRTTRQSVAPDAQPSEPIWRAEGWHALPSSRVYSDEERLLVTGDGPQGFLELHFQRAALIDRESPLFVRPLADRPGLFDATFLRSDGIGTRESKATAYETRLSAVGESTILMVAANDPDALYAIGAFFLTNFAEPDVISAQPYLEGAASLGHFEAITELAVIELFAVSRIRRRN